MADIADITQDRLEEEQSGLIDAIRAQANNIPAGVAGDCDYCGEWTSRLVNGACCPCRDRYKLG